MKHKYTTIFSSTIKPLVSEEKDKYLAMASLLDVGSFLPEIDTETNIDLLPVAFNACVINRVNKNGDVIDTETAARICESFINKPINIEHNRQRVMGTILTAGFSEFGTDQVLSAEQIRELKGPFNITLGGVLWKVVNNELTDIVEESADPTSDKYLSVSASWELGFTDYNLVAIEGDNKNLEGADIINDKDRVESLKDNLKCFGGDGKLEDDRYVYRQVINEVVPLGIGLTNNPAAEVEGVAVKKKSEENNDKQTDENESDDSTKTKTNKKPDKKRWENKSSQYNKQQMNKPESEKNIMKIEKLTDITDESMQTLSASAITTFVEEELQKASERFAEERDGHKKAIEDGKEKFENLTKEHDALKEDSDKIKAALEKLEAERAAKEAEEKFNQRMSYMDEEYVLNDEDREVLASDIKEMNDEDFEAFSKKLAVLMSAKNRKAIEDREAKAAETKAEEEKSEKAETETVESNVKEKVLNAESETKETEDVSSVVDEAVDQAEATENVAMPNSTDPSEPSAYDKYRRAFGLDQFTISR
jgi:hypothetical protein